MEPTILSTIIWGVIWFFGGHLGTGIILWTSAILGGAIGASKSKSMFDGKTETGLAGGILIGWILAIGWEIFVIVQVIIHVVTLIQLIIAGA